MIYDEVKEICAQLSALSDMAWCLDPDNIRENFGWGLGMILRDIVQELEALNEKSLREPEKKP